MFAAIAAFFALITEIVGGTFRLASIFISSCFGLALVLILVVGLMIFGLMHMA